MERKALRRLIILYVLLLVIFFTALALFGRIERRYTTFEGRLDLRPALDSLSPDERAAAAQHIVETVRARVSGSVAPEGAQLHLQQNEIQFHIAARLTSPTLEKLLTTPGKLEFAIVRDQAPSEKLFDSSGNLLHPEALPPGVSIVYLAQNAERQRQPLLIRDDTRWSVAPTDISEASASPFSGRDGRQYAVSVQLRGEAANQFAEMTQKYLKRRVAILVDGEVFSVPAIHMPIKEGRLLLTPYTDKESGEALGAIVANPLPYGLLKLSGKIIITGSRVGWDYKYSSALLKKSAQVLGSLALACLVLMIIGYVFLRDRTTLGLGDFAAAFFRTIRSAKRLAIAAIPIAILLLASMLNNGILKIYYGNFSELGRRFSPPPVTPSQREPFLMGLTTRLNWYEVTRPFAQLELGSTFGYLTGFSLVVLPLLVIVIYFLWRRRLALYAESAIADRRSCLTDCANRFLRSLSIAAIFAIPAFLFIGASLFVFSMQKEWLLFASTLTFVLPAACVAAIAGAATLNLARSRLADSSGSYPFRALESDVLRSFTPLFIFYLVIGIAVSVIPFDLGMLLKQWKIHGIYFTWLHPIIMALFLFVPFVIVLEGESVSEALRQNFRLLSRQLPAVAALALVGGTLFFIVDMLEEIFSITKSFSDFSLGAWFRGSLSGAIDKLIVCFFFFLLFMLFRAAREKAEHAEAPSSEETPKIPCIT